MRALFILTTALLLAFASSCRSTSDATRDDHDYVLAYLLEGPHLAAQTKVESQTIFAGHMANITRLANEHKLVIAGPFDKPHDKRLRGIFVLDVPTIEEAAQLVATDPAVKAGVFTTELQRMRAASSLRKTLELDAEDKAARKLAGKPAGPADGIRGYVLLTAQDSARAHGALAALDAQHKIVWSGRLADGRGVFALDAASVADAETLLANVRDALGTHTLDAWWSTKALERLPSLPR
jgi:uncharacterized protein